MAWLPWVCVLLYQLHPPQPLLPVTPGLEVPSMCLPDKAQRDALLGLSLSTEGLFLSEEASIPEYKALGNLPGKMSGGMPAISSGKGEGARAASSSERKVVLKGLMVKSLLISSAEYHQHGGQPGEQDTPHLLVGSFPLRELGCFQKPTESPILCFPAECEGCIVRRSKPLPRWVVVCPTAHLGLIGLCAPAWMSALRTCWVCRLPQVLTSLMVVLPLLRGMSPELGGTSSFTHPKGSPLPYITSDEMQNRGISGRANQGRPCSRGPSWCRGPMGDGHSVSLPPPASPVPGRLGVFVLRTSCFIQAACPQHWQRTKEMMYLGP